MRNLWVMLSYFKNRMRQEEAAAQSSVAQLVDKVIGSPVDDVVTDAPIERQTLEEAGASDSSAAQLVDRAVTGASKKYAKFKERRENGKSVLWTGDGFSIFASDNWEILIDKSEVQDISGDQPVILIDRLHIRTKYSVSKEFMKFAKDSFLAFRDARNREVSGNGDLNGKCRDGAINRQTDRPGHKTRPSKLVQDTRYFKP